MYRTIQQIKSLEMSTSREMFFESIENDQNDIIDSDYPIYYEE